MPQEHTSETDERFISDLLPVLRDERYVRIHGKALLLVYRTELLPDLARTTQVWREVASKGGVELYLCRVESFAREDLAPIGFDAACEFPPNISGVPPRRPDGFEGNLYDYRELVELMLKRPEAAYRCFHGATPCWDNTARMGRRASVFVNSSPELFRDWLAEVGRRTAVKFEGDEQMIFINAWNEWAEGCHLEPDQRYGRGYLEACKAAVEAVTADAGNLRRR